MTAINCTKSIELIEFQFKFPHEKETLADKPLDFESAIPQRAGLVIDWTSQKLLPCVDHRS